MAVQKEPVSPEEAKPMEIAPVQDGTLEYEVQGEGEPVLFIHGSHVAGAFRPFMSEPAFEGYRRIRYHRRGFAGSSPADERFSIERQAADAAAMLRHLGETPAHVMGHSYGGSIALQLAVDAPEMVHSLSLLEPALLTVPSAQGFTEETVMPALERYEAGDPEGAVDAFMQEVAGPEWRIEIAETVPGGPEQAEQDAATFFEVEVPALQEWEFGEGRAKQISQPVLYVQGGETLPMFMEGRRQVQSWMPQAEDHLVPNLNHALQMKDPRAVAEGIASFLARHPIQEGEG